MHPAELFQLRKKAVMKFQSPEKLRSLVNKIIVPPSRIPLVVGYNRFEEDQWQVSYLKPKTPSDEITLLNFLEGLKKVDEELQKNPHLFKSNNFKGCLLFQGVETQHCSNQDKKIMTISLEEGLGSYHFNIYWSGEDTYGTESKKEYSLIEKIMDPHIGPCKEYERTLI